MTRKVVKKGGYTFSDGTKVPEGAMVGVASHATHWTEGMFISYSFSPCHLH